MGRVVRPLPHKRRRRRRRRRSGREMERQSEPPAEKGELDRVISPLLRGGTCSQGNGGFPKMACLVMARTSVLPPQIKWRVSKKGEPNSWLVPRFYLLKWADLVRFPSAFGPWWACLFFFRERWRDFFQSTRISGVPPIPSTMQFPIQTGVSAPTASVGGGAGSLCGPLIV